MTTYLVAVTENIQEPIIGTVTVHQHYTDNCNPAYEEVMAGQYGSWSGEGAVNVNVNILVFDDHAFAPMQDVEVYRG